MRIIIGLGHPAHFHLFKDAASTFIKNGHEVLFVITPKDVLLSLVNNSGFKYETLLYNKDFDKNISGKLKKIFSTSRELLRICRTFKPDLLIGSMTQLAYIGRILNKPVLFFAEDDLSYTFIQGMITYPFVNYIVSPIATSVGPFRFKKIGYPSYQKLSYLHPIRFSADNSVLDYYRIATPYVFIRMASLKAHHDTWSKAIGLTVELVKNIIKLVENEYKVYISAEISLPPELQQFELKIDPKDVHHILANATLFIGDSQSMTVESAMLGVPSIRFNSFIGKISILEELEHKYELTYGIPPTRPDLLMDKIKQILSIQNMKDTFQNRRAKMLHDKIDITSFIIWLVENYPRSVKEVRTSKFDFERFN
jgi:uncharacterized protein